MLGSAFFDAVVRTKVAAKWCIVVYMKTNVGHMSPRTLAKKWGKTYVCPYFLYFLKNKAASKYT